MRNNDLKDLTDVAREVDGLREQLDEVSRRRVELVLKHFDAGVPATQIARAAGIARGYVYQLKDTRENDR